MSSRAAVLRIHLVSIDLDNLSLYKPTHGVTRGAIRSQLKCFNILIKTVYDGFAVEPGRSGIVRRD